jgi:nucleotide-binding universal stress UspA family protein
MDHTGINKKPYFWDLIFSKMKLFKHIICPFDNSEFARKALDYGAKLAQKDGDKLSILHIMVNPFVFDGGNPILSNNVLAVDLLDKMRKEQVEHLEQVISELKQTNPGLDVEVIMKENNDVGEGIREFQEETGADLVVMGSHGRKGIKRFLLGSVAEAVLRSINCPVLIVK